MFNMPTTHTHTQTEKHKNDKHKSCLCRIYGPVYFRGLEQTGASLDVMVEVKPISAVHEPVMQSCSLA